MSAMTTGILALLLNPAVQYRGQEQIDIVVGRRRLPSFSDRDQLPYITAICREIMRWKLVLPLGVYHASTEDDVYDGYFIPKGNSLLFCPYIANFSTFMGCFHMTKARLLLGMRGLYFCISVDQNITIAYDPF